MAKVTYSRDVCRELIRLASDPGVALRYRRDRYEDGDELEVEYTTVWPESSGSARFQVQKFVGGGFAGQVYRCVALRLSPGPSGNTGGLRVGGVYAVKMMLPPSRFSRAFRDLLYWVAFQGPFSAQVNRAACRAGLLWQRLARLGWELETGVADGVAEVNASFYDAELGAYGEIREWVEGRTWRLEPDLAPERRRQWRTIPLDETQSPEFVAKRRFMHRFVQMLHDMGAEELARQYEWWTMKSQPNALKRSGSSGPGDGLCAVDFRAGLALVPFLPMSPADVVLILRGLRRRSLAQFDRADFRKLRQFVARHEARCPDLRRMAEALEFYDRDYRRSLPDLTHQAGRLLGEPDLRRSVRRGLIDGYSANGLVDQRFAEALGRSPLRFGAFYLLGALPLLGRGLRRVWGRPDVRRHVARMLASPAYFLRASRAGVAGRLVNWLRQGRVGEDRARFLARWTPLFWLQRFTLGLLPAGLHRWLAEPAYAWGRLRDGLRFAASFYRDAAFRERWLTELVEEGYADGVLTREERDQIAGQVKDPYIVKYLKSLAVHLCMMPTTHIVAFVVGCVAASRHLAAGGDWPGALIEFGKWQVIFQIIPISPGSIARGLYVVYLMIRERNYRDYIVAAPLAFLKMIGYLAFPIQMVATYPALARFMASRWATSAVHVVPVFGEKGALLEHGVFDVFFNRPRVLGGWLAQRVRLVLDLWLILGLAALGAAFVLAGWSWSSKGGLNLLLAVVCLCILPRVLIYPLLAGRRRKSAPASPGEAPDEA